MLLMLINRIMLHLYKHLSLGSFLVLVDLPFIYSVAVFFCFSYSLVILIIAMYILNDPK